MHLADHWGLRQFLHLRVLDIKLIDFMISMVTEDVQQRFHSILAFLTRLALDYMRLALRFLSHITLSTQDTDPRDATTDADHAQYADLHAALARPTFSSLHRVTLVVYCPGPQTLMSAKDMALKRLDFLRVLLAPWCVPVRGIVSLTCIVQLNTVSFRPLVHGV